MYRWNKFEVIEKDTVSDNNSKQHTRKEVYIKEEKQKGYCSINK